MPVNLDFSFRAGSARRRDPDPDEGCLRVAFLGDFSGRDNQCRAGRPSRPRARSSYRVEAGTLDAVMAALQPRLELALGDPPAPVVALEFRELDDFHPEALYDRLELCAALRQLRDRLQNPATFAAAAALLSGLASAPSGVGPAAGGPPAPPVSPPPPAAGGSLAELLTKPAQAPPAFAPGLSRGGPADSLIRAAVGPYVLPRPEARLPECLGQVDAALTGRLRAVLHHPDFQALESLWRGVDFLLRRVDADRVDVHLVDVGRAELPAALAQDGQPPGWLQAWLGEARTATSGEAPWGLLIGGFAFGPAPEDSALLSALGTAAQRVGAPFLAAARPELLGAASALDLPTPTAWTAVSRESAAAWEALRASGSATYLGLAAPRFLLRLPYGAKGDPVARFGFEELTAPSAHHEYLWGNPALLCACALAETYVAEGRVGPAQGAYEAADLPYFAYREDGESRVLPCAEVWLPDRVAERLLEEGIMPVQSMRGRDAVRLVLRSLCRTTAALAGGGPAGT